MNRGDWINGKPSPNPADAANAWKKQVVLAEHELPGTARHDPLAYLQNRSVDWLDHQLAARELLSIDPADTYLVVEHEYPPARIQDKARLAPILKGSLAFVKAIDEAAAAMFALQHEVMAAQRIPIQGTGRGSVSIMIMTRTAERDDVPAVLHLGLLVRHAGNVSRRPTSRRAARRPGSRSPRSHGARSSRRSSSG